MKEPNTITASHFKIANGTIHLADKEYFWHTPKALRGKNIQKGDVVIIISEFDRLGRNKEDTLKELRHFKDIGVRLMILEIPTTLVDYSAMDNTMANMIMETINNMLVNRNVRHVRPF